MKRPTEEQTRNVILDSIADGVFTVDEEWRIASFNRPAENITGVRRGEAIGRRCRDVFHASICESECALGKTIRTGRPIVDLMIEIQDARGRRIPVSISTAILTDGDGNPMGGVETFRDLSRVSPRQIEDAGIAVDTKTVDSSDLDQFLCNLGGRVRELRKKKGLRQEDFDDGTALAISTRGLQAIEYGKKSPRISTLRRIAKRLGVDLKELLDFD